MAGQPGAGGLCARTGGGCWSDTCGSFLLAFGFYVAGVVYATLVWSLATADPLRGGVLMAAFGIGTLPMLLALGSVADKLLSLTRRPRVRQIAGSVIIVMGLLTLFAVIRPLLIGTHLVDHNLCGSDYLSGKVTN